MHHHPTNDKETYWANLTNKNISMILCPCWNDNLQEDDGKSKGFGFINFDSADAAADAVEKNNGTFLEGKELWCGRAQKKAEREAELKQK